MKIIEMKLACEKRVKEIMHHKCSICNNNWLESFDIRTQKS